MQRTLTLYQTTIGKKAVVAITGIILLGFVIGHLLGNLQIYLGPEAFNGYAEFLHGKPGLVWGTRFVLLFSVIAHIATTFQLWARNRAARPVDYKKREDNLTNYAAKTMVFTGPTLLLFILYHLAHLTLYVAPGTEEFTRADVYRNVIMSFSCLPVAGFYVLAMLSLGFHLYHGIWSLFQSLGINHPRYNALRKKLAVALTAFLVLGNCSIPISVYMGWIQ